MDSRAPQERAARYISAAADFAGNESIEAHGYMYHSLTG
jgi:hypothetical protein